MRGPPPLSAVAATTQRLAVLLAAGVAPPSAWRYLAEFAPGAVVDAVVAGDSMAITDSILSTAKGMPQLESEAWRGLAAAWSVATRAGAPLAPSLRNYAAALRELSQVQRDIAVALAAPVSTARVVLALPVIGLLLATVLGFDPWRVLFTTPAGGAMLAVGAGLVGAAIVWNRRLVASAQPANATPGIECELMAIAVAGGGSLDRAVRLVHETLVVCDLTVQGELAHVLELSRRAGVPAADLLRSEADEQRRAARAQAQHAAAALSVRLMLPLGLCILPAFLVLGVVPLFASVISSTVGTF